MISLERTNKSANIGFFFIGVIVLLTSIFTAIVLENLAIACILPAFLFIVLCLYNSKIPFYLFFLLIPFSIEMELPGGFGTDLPSEPIMIGLTGLFFILLFLKKNKNLRIFINNPISIILILHLAWVFSCCFFSTYPVISVKYFAAKLWYVIPFYFLPLYLISNEKDLKQLFIILISMMVIAIVFVLFKHMLDGFSFIGANFVVRPIFRNHVSYAAMITILLPFLWPLYKSSTSNIQRGLCFFVLMIFLIGIYFSYTRAAYVVAFSFPLLYLVIQFRLLKLCIVGALIVAAFMLYNLFEENKYLELAPNYETTVAHKKFDNLVEATYNMEDISTMERLYRWVAGFRMIEDKPVFGHGPATFFENYKAYTLSSFKTYVSDNPEKSGIHNNYLMILIEQGFLGLFLFLSFVIICLVYGSKVFLRSIHTIEKSWILAFVLCFYAICVFLLVNDLIQTDKIGPFFFFSASVISLISIKQIKFAQTN